MWYGTGFLGIQLVGSGGYVPKPIQDDNFLNGLPANWTYGSTVSSTDLLWDDYPGRVWNDYGVGVPRIIPGKGLLFESGRNNRFLNSAAPANHTTASVPVGLYIVWMNGFGSLTVAAGTAAGTGFGTATQGVPIWVNVTTAGTVVVTVSGLVYAIQMEAVGVADQAVPTSFIRTTVGALGRGNIYLTCPVPAGFNLAQCTYFIEWQPLNSLVVNSRLIEVSGTAGSAVDFDRVIYTSGTALRGTTASNSVIQGNAIPTTVVNMGLIHRAAYSVKVGAAVLGIDGDVPTAVAQAARPVDLITIALMNAATGNVPVQGYLRAFKYWPVAANAEQVQVMTQPDIPIPTWDDTFYGKIPAPFVFSRTSVATDLIITDPPGRVWNDFASADATVLLTRLDDGEWEEQLVPAGCYTSQSQCGNTQSEIVYVLVHWHRFMHDHAWHGCHRQRWSYCCWHSICVHDIHSRDANFQLHRHCVCGTDRAG